MPDELVFYTNPMSRGRIARWMLEETGQPYRTELLDYPAMKQPAYLAINPMGKVPALAHGGTIITETAAICAYLADAFPATGLAPNPQSSARGVYYRWMFYGAGPAEAAIINKGLGFEVPPQREAMAGYGTFAAVMDTLEHLVSHQTYMLGEHFSAVDIYLGSQIGWGLAFGSIDKRPAFERYWSRIKDRPAAIRAREIDDALIPKPAASS